MFSRLRLLPLLLTAVLTAHAQPPASVPATPPANSALDGELFYQLMVGELSTQRGEAGAGYSLILDAARKTGDARLYQRAIDIALQSRAGDSALQAARAWKQAQPGSRDANRYVLQILIGLNHLNETVEPLKREITLADAKDRTLTITTLPRYFARSSDKKLATEMLEQALAEYLTNPGTGAAAWSAVGRMRLENQDSAGALEAARRGQAMDARTEGPALLALALMSPQRPGAEAIVRKYLEGRPLVEVRLAYARALLDAQRYAEAGSQIQIVTSEKPDYAEAWLIRGTLELQDNRFDSAERSLKQFLELMQSRRGNGVEEPSRALAQAYLSLAQIAEQRKDYKMAESWLGKISSPEDLVRTQSRRAGILARQGRIDEARELIRNLPERTPADARVKLSSEIQLLRDNKLYSQAYDLLAEATQRDPKDYDLVYDQATLAEKLGRTDEMEKLLRRIIAEKPQYHHAYNALGYSFADRSVRLGEARQLILKALEFAPDDPFISDSLGWVEFREGNKPEALRVLQQAYRTRPDAEIAAHLGEVLWSMGQREQALSVWREGLQLNAENETLVETLKRLRVKP
ncbi:MAG: tetratricopeptide repeat protein [Burkholderiales bacterium]|nr:tetratricopeptide repeat protein [Burkholderiales bacterium]